MSLVLQLAMNLTVKERASLSELEDLLIREVLAVVITYFWYGIFILLFVASIILHLRQKDRKLPHNILFGVTIISLLLDTVYVGSRSAEILAVIDHALVKNNNMPLDTLFTSTLGKLQAIDVVMSWAIFIPAVIVDATIIWRVRALCQDKPWLIAFPCALWLGTFGTTFCYATWLSVPSGYQMATHPAPTAINNVIIAGVTLSNATNLVTTAIFGWTLFRLRSILKMRETPVQNIIFLTIEYGTMYLVIQLVYLAFLANPPTARVLQIFFWIVAATYPSLSAMYPTAIMVLTKHSASSSMIIMANSKIADTSVLATITTNGPREEQS